MHWQQQRQQWSLAERGLTTGQVELGKMSRAELGKVSRKPGFLEEYYGGVPFVLIFFKYTHTGHPLLTRSPLPILTPHTLLLSIGSKRGHCQIPIPVLPLWAWALLSTHFVHSGLGRGGTSAGRRSAKLSAFLASLEAPARKRSKPKKRKARRPPQVRGPLGPPSLPPCYPRVRLRADRGVQ